MLSREGHSRVTGKRIIAQLTAKGKKTLGIIARVKDYKDWAEV